MPVNHINGVKTAELTNNTKDAELTNSWRETNFGEYIPKGADEAMKKATKASRELVQKYVCLVIKKKLRMRPWGWLAEAKGGGTKTQNAHTSALLTSALAGVIVASLRVWSLITVYTAQYPLLGIFLALFAALSFLPIVSFLIFVVVSLVIAVSTAVVAVFIIEGILVSIAGTILLGTLFISLTTATFLIGWIAFFIYGFRAVNLALDTLNTWQQQSVSAAAAAAATPVSADVKE
ncbi:hypothetical protein BC937DRAFT_93348 [Endogone sp. FLAS-F59071]|nr:hypothetical protein BC937DRAFT_93348 [Endogone sp. FLAS-F59071]|eukprot:RUS14781.1 hypothetical protein BC937DRAFT_93348 [Endogone sp. FLAS-F59071]